MVTGASNLIHLNLVLKAETDKAILVACGDEEYWLPKSQILTNDPDGQGNIEVELPERLAFDKGLI